MRSGFRASETEHTARTKASGKNLAFSGNWRINGDKAVHKREGV